MTLDDFTPPQLERLYDKVYERMVRGMGYQAFGYDIRTIPRTTARLLTEIVRTICRKEQRPMPSGLLA